MFWQPAFRTVRVNAVIFSFFLNSQPFYPGFCYGCLSNCMHTVKILIKTDTTRRFMQVFNIPEENWKDEFVYKPINGKISKSYFPLTRSCLKRVFSCSSRTIFLINCVLYFESLHHAFKTNWCMISLLSHHISNQGNEPQSVDKSCQRAYQNLVYESKKWLFAQQPGRVSKKKQMPSSWKFGQFLRNPFPQPLESILSLLGITKWSGKHKWLYSLPVEISWEWNEVDAVSTLRKNFCVALISSHRHVFT